MTRRRSGPALMALVLTLLAALLAAPAGAASRAGAGRSRTGSVTTGSSTISSSHPVTAWGSAMAWGYGLASNVTVRQMARLSVGGTQVRVRVSNVFGHSPLVIAAASVGLERYRADLVPGSLRPLRFAGAPTVTVPVGGLAYSDPVALTVHAGATLAVSLYVPGSDLVSVHPCCTASPLSYFTPNGGGNRADQVGSLGYTTSSPWGRWVDAVDVFGGPTRGAAVVFGDSISDGFNTSVRWPDVLARRVRQLPADQRVAVVDEGITANTLTDVHPSYALVGGGPPGLDRLERDALSQPGVTHLLLLLGTNDLWFGATANQVISGMEQVVARAHAQGVHVIGVTLLPRAGSERWTPQMETYRNQVNQWMRTSGTFATVLDLASVVSDVYNGACDRHAMFPPYDSGDHLHPGPAGQTAMANALPTTLLGAGAAPTVPPLVAVHPTPGCVQRPALIERPPVAPVQATSPSASASPSTSASPSGTPSRAFAPGTPGASQPPVGNQASASHLNSAADVGVPAAAAVLVLALLAAVGRRRRIVRERAAGRQHRR